MLYILIIVIGGLLSFIGPWWIIIPLCMALNFTLAKSAKQAFGISALAVTTLWVAYALYLHLSSEVDMIEKLAQLFTANSAALAKIPATGLIFSIISLIAALIGGFGGLSGYNAKKLIKNA